ncbi:uncharacterized protein [Clytia hemisphaerica]|uniref:uncharacterized protein isoform X2 n=1 Tax=Clytia hemisphaerica TaxID=252671 RepID=UPI0034D672F1
MSVESAQVIKANSLDGIYSKQKTANGESIEDVPYFILNQFVKDARKTEHDEFVQNLHERDQSIECMGKELSKNLKEIENLRFDINRFQVKMEEQNKTMKNLTEENARLMRMLKESSNQLKSEEEKNKELSRNYNAELKDVHEKMINFEKYKNEYDHLDVDFQNFHISPSTRKISHVPKNVKVAERKDQLNSIHTLEKHLNELQNRFITEYDQHLASRRRNFLHSEKRKSIIPQNDAHEKDDQEDEEEVKGMKVTTKNFLESVKNIQREIGLLKEQEQVITKEVSIIEEDEGKGKERTANKYNKRKPSFKKKESEMTGDLMKLMEKGNTENPFVPNQQVLNKFSFMLMQSTNNGQYYTEVPGCDFCQSCREKTFICLHKLNCPEHILNFTTPCTDLKFIRLKVPAPANKSKAKDAKRKITFSSKELYFHKKVWPWYHEHFPEDPPLTRLLQKGDLLDLIHEFFAYMLWMDNGGDEDNNTPRAFLDSLKSFIESRYHDNQVVGVVLHEILSHTEKFQKENQEIKLFGKICNGSMDAASFRYVLNYADIINNRRWRRAEEVEVLFKTLYHFATDEEVDVMKIGYISFSENKINPTLLQSYVLYMLLHEKEPRMIELSASLRSHPVRRPGYFTDIEFAEAIETLITPLYSDHLRRRLFESAMLSSNKPKSGLIKVDTAAQICAYLVMASSNFQRKISQHKDTLGDSLQVFSAKMSKDGEKELLPSTSSLGSFSIELQRRRSSCKL